MLKYTIQFIAALFLSVVVYAVELPPIGTPLEGSKGQLKAGAISLVKDQDFYDDLTRTTKKFTATGIKNIISFQLDEASTLYLKAPFKATLTYRLYYKFKNSPNRLDSLSTNQVLELVYDTASTKTFNARKTVEFNDAVEVTVKVITIQTNASGWDPIAALVVRNDIIVNRTYTFDCEINKVAQINFTPPTLANADELRVSWLKSEGIDEYDLEWTYIDETAYTTNVYGTPGSAEFAKNIFKNKSSRVTLGNTAEEYFIPLLYENKGYVFMRIRGVQVTELAKRFETNWSAYNQYNFVPGHQSKLNWQAATSFAEEGKRKSVVQYFDGSLRNRQTVTKDNSTKTTVVAETEYDYQGRPVIQVLPAPTLNTIITYTPNFNSLLNSSALYYKDVYDQLKAGETVCNNVPPAMDPTKGAAQYYSPNNPLKTQNFNQFIPDAKGYPYTQTQYTQDNTGRIKSQGGVGVDHRLGSGHETKYFYSTPDQAELDALFGTEAGSASHYFKNMVRDANGQYSVSYIDMHGRTVATALAGELYPVNLEYLPSKTAAYNANNVLTRTLTSPENNIIKGLVIESSKGLVVPRTSTHSFTYSLLPENVNIKNCQDADICYTCSYNLEITISDDCGNTQFGGTPFVYTDVIGGININPNCSLNSLFEKKFDKSLAEGSYTINKKLTIRDEALKAYEASFATSNICKTLDQFVQEQADVYTQSTNGCATPCANCTAQLGTSKAAFVSAFIADNGLSASNPVEAKLADDAYNKLLAQCQELCNTAKLPNKLDNIYQLMLKDVTPPYGQYADLYEDITKEKETPPNSNPTTVVYGPFNIFSLKTGSTSQMKYQSVAYKLADNVTDIKISIVRNGEITSLTPAQLTKEEFAANFQPEWAEILVKAFHPEYAKYSILKNAATVNNGIGVGTASYDWDMDFLITDTYTEALQKGYLNPTNNATFATKFPTQFPGVAANADPFFKLHSTIAGLLHGYMTSIATGTPALSIWSAASVIGFCKDPKDAACVTQHTTNPFPAANTCSASMDYAWRSFRAMYIGKKEELIMNMVNGAVPNVMIDSRYRTYFVNTKNAVTNATGISDFSTTTQVDNKLQEYYAGGNTCSEYADLWWNQLGPCTLEKLSAYKTQIKNDLINVCVKGTDKDHVMGASSIAPTATNTYNDFDAVIAHYVDVYNAANPNSPINPLDCNGSLIKFPAPYSKPQVIDNKPIITKPEACECEKITALYARYNAERKDVDFSAYIKRTLQTTISNEDLQTLLGLCDNSITCKFIPKPISLPPALQCGMDNICVPCSVVTQAYKEYKIQYPDWLPATEEATENQQKINGFFAHFMNDRLGFNKAVPEYLQFLNNCGFADPEIVCDSLQALKQRYDMDVNPFRVRAICQSNSLTPPIYLTDISASVTDGTFHWPQTIRDTAKGFFEYFQHVLASGTFCFENGYAIEFKFKFLKDDIRPVEEFFYYTDPNGGFVLSKIKGGPVANQGIFLDRIVTVDPVSGQTVTLSDQPARINSNPDLIFQDWTIIKFEISSTKFRVYANNVLIKEASRTSVPLKNWSAFTLSFMHFQGVLDWTKIYNNTGKLVFFDDYLTNTTRQTVDPAFVCPQPSTSCQQSFTNYFNQQKGTSYTFNQIDSLYNSTCGYNLDVCNGPAKDILTSLIDSFYVNAKPGRVAHDFSTQEGEVYHNLKDLTHDGVIYLPDSIRQRASTWYNNYQFNFNAFCTNNGYTIESKFKFLDLAHYGDVFYLGYRSLQALFFLTKASSPGKPAGLYITGIDLYGYNYGGYPVESLPNVSILVDTDTNAILKWMTIKAVVKPDKYQLYYNGTLVFERSRNPSIPIANQQNFGLGLYGRYGAIDYVRIGDVNDNVKYFEDFNDLNRPATVDPSFNCSGFSTDCQGAFTAYFNQKRGTNFNYQQIDSIYLAATGKLLDVCYAQPPVTDNTTTTAYQKVYTATGFNEFPVDMVQAADNGMVIVGNTRKSNNNKYLATIIKTNEDGTVQWAKQYGDSTTAATTKRYNNFSSVIKTSDGGYLVAGVTDNYVGAEGASNLHTKPLVVKYTPDGNIAWSKIIGTAVNDGGTAFYGSISNAISLVKTVEGNYAISYAAAGLTGTGIITSMLNAQGDVVWTKSYFPNVSAGTVSFTPETVHNYVYEQGDSLVVFSTGNPGTQASIKNAIWATKVHKTSGVARSAVYFVVNNAAYTYGYKCIQSDKGFSFTAGYTGAADQILQGVAVLHLDNNLNVLSIVTPQTVSGTVMSPGSFAFDGGAGNLLAARTDNNSNLYFSHGYNGNTIWSRTLSNIKGIPLLMKKDAGKNAYTMAGTPSDVPAGFYLARSGVKSSLPCGEKSFAGLTYTNVPYTISTKTIDVQNTIKDNTLGAVTLTSRVHPVVATAKCLTAPPPAPYPDMVLCGNTNSTKIPLEIVDDGPCAGKTAFSVTRGYDLYNNYVETKKAEFRNTFIAKCLQAAQRESFTVKQVVREYHFTLYYYDQAGNLVKTVPPKGVKVDYSATWLNKVKTARTNGTAEPQVHSLVTQYRYNTLNQVVQQYSPDAAYSNFWYDILGRLVLSQNAQQAVAGADGAGVRYSYTQYDELGRIKEVGQINSAIGAVTNAVTRVDGSLNNWMTTNAANKRQVTATVYDVSPKQSFLQKDLAPYILDQQRGNYRNRVSFTLFSKGGTLTNYDYASFYNYDIHGNVNIFLHDYGAAGTMAQQGHRYKRITYQYDLISGKVNSVSYQPRLYDPVTNLYTVQPDAFYHKYVYDAENRLTDVYTALTENAPLIQQDHDAYYQYYKHGPLARTVLGQNQVQGLDYMYTIHGWLKGVNGSAVNSLYDAGQDGATTGANRLVARDAFGFSLQYYAYDYIPVYNGIKTLVNVINTLGTTIAKPLYNGNISNMVVNIPTLGNAQVNNYTYDQLNRLTAMDPYDGFNNTDNTFTPVASTNYKERISYDPNGNILTYARNGAAASKPMDALTYNYKANTNQLDYVADAIAATTYTEDIDNQAAANYTYDKIGNLVKDNAEGISNITWTVYGKIDKITKTDGTVIQYAYDAAGNRISKAVTKAGQTTSTFYVRDAQGNTMAVYEQNSAVNSGHFTLDEQYMYGSSRLGVYNAGKDLTLPANTPINLGSSQSAVLATFERGKKFFELSNHLGNVLVTIRDDKKAVASNNTIAYYTANVVSANDYYPFGMQMPGRKFNAGIYRYGFNGKENDNDVKGQGNQQDYGMRIYDTRLGKFLSVDPLTKEYPWNSTYSYTENSPVSNVDLDGLERVHFNLTYNSDGKPIFKMTGQIDYTYQERDGLFSKLKTKYYHAQSVVHYNGNTYYFFLNNSISERSQSIPEWNRGKYNYDQLSDFLMDRGQHYISEEQADRSDKISMFRNATESIAWGMSGTARFKQKSSHFEAGMPRSAIRFTASELKILKQASSVINSKEFTIIRAAHQNGVSAEINVNGIKVLYNPEWTYSEAMTLHSEGGFMLGPKAFSSKGAVENTVVWEVTRLNTQNTGELGVDKTKEYTNSAQKTADKLTPYVHNK